MFQYLAEVLRVVDGDTLWLDVDLGFRTHHQVDVRLAHINTPEVNKFEVGNFKGPAAAYVERSCPPGSMCVVDIIKQEKYGRWLAVIHYAPGERDLRRIIEGARVLNDDLVREGYAMPYEGGKK